VRQESHLVLTVGRGADLDLRQTNSPHEGMKITNISEPEPIELQRFPYPYQAAFTVASDIDSANISRFRGIHSLLCARDIINEKSPEWNALGLKSSCCRFEAELAGVRGFGFDFADSFFLVGDPTTFGMYSFLSEKNCFREAEQEGENCAALVRQWLKEGQIDSFHAFLHYTRRQVEPLLKAFYRWCESKSVAKPRVWINHSTAVTPTGLCPDNLQPTCMHRFARVAARNLVGPLFGRKHIPLGSAFVRYQGASPGSPHYVNDLLAANGLRYVWLNMQDIYCNRIALTEERQNGRPTILHPVTMDDGIRYWRFERCYGSPNGKRAGVYLRDSEEGVDSSHLITEPNLQELCRANGTCILYTHWTHPRSMPIADETLRRFELLRTWHEAGKVWATTTARLLEWTRLRTFLRIVCRREGERLVIEIEGLDDPIHGRESLSLKDLDGLCIRLNKPDSMVTLAINGQALSSAHLRRRGDFCWIDAGNNLCRMPTGVSCEKFVTVASRPAI
jgi:hypothetical protein